MRFAARASLPYSNWRKPIILAERYLRHRYEEGFKVGYEEGFAAGFEKGFIKGLAEARAARFEEGRLEGRAKVRTEIHRREERYRARLKAWDARRLKSIADGEPFDEPLPEFDDDDKAEVDA